MTNNSKKERDSNPKKKISPLKESPLPPSKIEYKMVQNEEVFRASKIETKIIHDMQEKLQVKKDTKKDE